MWVVSVCWGHPLSTPPRPRLEETAKLLGRMTGRLSWYAAPHPGAPPDLLVREPYGWGALSRETLEAGRGVFLSTGGKCGAMLTLFEYEPRRHRGTCRAELCFPGPDPDAEGWARLLGRLCDLFEAHEAAALPAAELHAWVPGMDGFAPGRYTLLRDGSLHFPQMAHLGFPHVLRPEGHLYALPGRVPVLAGVPS